MAGANKLLTAGGGGVILTPASSIASDKTVQIPAQDCTLASTVDAAQYYGFKNRIINGAMQIDQRNAGASVTLSNGADSFSVDRFKFYRNVGGTFTAQRSTTVPAGFTNSLLITASTGASPTAAQYNFFKQDIEGLNVADLGWGTANAQPVTISFWARSSIVGSYGLSAANNSIDRSYVAVYTINSANTWEYKTVTIPGDTTGTWATDTNAGLRVYFDLGAGTDSNATAGVWNASWKTRTSSCVIWGATTGATFYITGLQLEKGSIASSFDYRPYSAELSLCQRYLPAFSGLYNTWPAMAYNTTACLAMIAFPVPTRIPPTGIYISSAGHFISWKSNAVGSAAGAVTLNAASSYTAVLEGSAYAALTFSGGGAATNFQANNSSAVLYFTGCEL